MLYAAIIILSIAVIILILYLANVKLEFKLNKSAKDSHEDAKQAKLDTLTNTEMSILKKVATGKTNKDIAEELFISVHTVKKHISNIFKKLDIQSRSEARKFYPNK